LHTLRILKTLRVCANSGHCGIGEMWGYYIGGMLAAREFSDDTWYEDRGWFWPGILRQLGSNARTDRPLLTSSLTEKQIFDCLTSDVTNHEQLRTKLISKYGRQLEITAVFEDFGF
jgi:hypothetical protein